MREARRASQEEVGRKESAPPGVLAADDGRARGVLLRSGHEWRSSAPSPWWTLPASGAATALLATLIGLTACARARAVRPIESLRG